MKAKLFLVLIPLVSIYISSCNKEIGEASLETTADSVAYIIGHLTGSSLASMSLTEINVAAVANGLQDAMDEKELFMDPNSANMFINNYFTELANEASGEYLEEGRAFLEENGKRGGVVTTESGLQYEILSEGDGPVPGPDSEVTVHYHGTLIDGTVFDSSVERGEPASFPVQGVIPGWTEVLQLMPVGSKWKVYIPTELAYHQNPRPGGPIKPNMALIFEIELLSIDN